MAQLATSTPPPVPVRYLTVKQYCDAYPWPGERSLRHWIFQAADNGANAWIRRIGRSLVIDVPALQRWIDERGAADPTPARRKASR